MFKGKRMYFVSKGVLKVWEDKGKYEMGKLV